MKAKLNQGILDTYKAINLFGSNYTLKAKSSAFRKPQESPHKPEVLCSKIIEKNLSFIANEREKQKYGINDKQGLRLMKRNTVTAHMLEKRQVTRKNRTAQLIKGRKNLL